MRVDYSTIDFEANAWRELVHEIMLYIYIYIYIYIYYSVAYIYIYIYIKQKRGAKLVDRSTHVCCSDALMRTHNTHASQYASIRGYGARVASQGKQSKVSEAKHVLAEQPLK